MTEILWGVVLPLLLAALLLALLVVFAQRASRALARTREVAGFQREAAELAVRIDASLAALVPRIDAVRRHQLQPQEVEAELDEGLDSLGLYLEEARAIRTPPELSETRDFIAHEIERAVRALEMIRHGVRLAAAGRGRRGELEAQTSIKRGFLGLLHAREAVAEHGADLAAARDAAARKWRTSRI